MAAQDAIPLILQGNSRGWWTSEWHLEAQQSGATGANTCDLSYCRLSLGYGSILV